jgi:hypothetical protein
MNLPSGSSVVSNYHYILVKGAAMSGKTSLKLQSLGGRPRSASKAVARCGRAFLSDAEAIFSATLAKAKEGDSTAALAIPALLGVLAGLDRGGPNAEA